MPLREPRLEEDRRVIDTLLGWSGASIGSICKFVRTIAEASYVRVNEKFVYNRGTVQLEDTEKRFRECWMISIWSSEIEEQSAQCLFQQPIPIKLRFTD